MDPDIRQQLNEERLELRRLAREEAEAKRLADLAREQAIQVRQKMLSRRQAAPDRYQPPQTADELVARYKNGERYFVGVKLPPGTRLFGTVLSGSNFSECDWTGANLKGVDLCDCLFKSATLQSVRCDRSTHLDRSEMPSANLARADFGGMVASEVDLSDSILTGASLTGAELRKTALDRAAMDDCDVTKAFFVECTFRGCVTLFAASNLATARWERCRFQGLDCSQKDLADVVFDACDLSDTRWRDCDISNAKFLRCKLGGAILNTEKVAGAEFRGSQMANAAFPPNAAMRAANWEGIDLSDGTYESVEFAGISLNGIKAKNAVFRSCDFSECALHDADLSSSLFSGCTFRKADFSATVVSGANFTGADLHGVIGLEFDSNGIRDAQISPKSNDTWSVLRRDYTGTRFGFHLLIFAIFLAPYMFRAAFWIEVNWAQEASTPIREWVAKAMKETPMPMGTARQEIILSARNKCLAPDCERWKVWHLLLGLDRPWYSTALAILLIIYNSARVFLTWKVGPLRDDEERTGITPAKEDYQSLQVAHRVFSLVFYVALAALALHLWDWLNSPIELPRAGPGA